MNKFQEIMFRDGKADRIYLFFYIFRYFPSKAQKKRAESVRCAFSLKSITYYGKNQSLMKYYVRRLP